MEKPERIKYTIRERDNLQSIAQNCGVTVADLLKDNIHISMSRLSAGDVIYLSGASDASKLKHKSYFGRDFRRMRGGNRRAGTLIMEEEQITLIMRQIFNQHINLTRMVIMAIDGDLPTMQSTVEQLFKTATALGGFMGKFYGESEGKNIKRLFEEHIVLGGELITAIKDKDATTFKRLEDAWYKNADDIAKAFSQMSVNYDEQRVREMMYMHLDLSIKEARAYIEGQYDEDFKFFEELTREGMTMADYLTVGIYQKTKDY